MKIFIITISILIFVTISSAQEVCELTLAQSPTLQNLKLGMSPTDASNVLGIKVKVKPIAQRIFFKNYIKKPAKGSLTGIRAIYLRFYNAKLYQIELFYDKDYRWQTLENFIHDYSTLNNFPKEFWQTEYGYSKANCNGFTLDADYVLNPHVQLTNDAIAEVVENERAEKEKDNTK